MFSTVQRHPNIRAALVCSALTLALSGCALLGGERDAPLDAESLLSGSDVSLQEILNHAEFMSNSRSTGKLCVDGIGKQPQRLSETITVPPPNWPEWAAMPFLEGFFRHYVFVQDAQKANSVYLMRDTTEYPAPECYGPFERSKVARFLSNP